MKKFIIVLMVVAVASFLFVGCLPTTPETPTEPTEPTEPTVAATVAPIITAIPGISLTSTATQYINATEAAVVTVAGTAPTYSEVKVYVDDVCAGTADVGVTGTFLVVVAEADLGADGEKVIYATAKEAAIDVSAHSVEYAFVLDQVAPSATTLAATADTALALDSAIVSGKGIAVDSFGVQGLGVQGLGTLAAGTWTITCLADSSVNANVTISDGTTTTTYTVNDADIFNGVIPGVYFVFADGFDAGDVNTVTITTAIAERATVLFDEEVTFATASDDSIVAATLGNYVWTAWTLATNATKGAVAAGTFVNYDAKTAYFTPVFFTVVPQLARYDTLTCVVNGMTDLAGNTQTVANVLSCTVGAASATALLP